MPVENRRAMIFVNGSMPDLKAVEGILKPGDYLVAVDGGLEYIKRLRKTPNLLVGDMDSIQPGDLEAMEKAGVIIHRFPPEKDDTDLELALQVVLRMGFRDLCVIGALGNRIDHTLANIFLLTRPELADLDLRLDDGQVEAFLIYTEALLKGQRGDLVSLLPLLGKVEGILTRHLRYPLHDETLYPDHTRGISNEMLGPEAGVRIKSGILLCIHTRQSKP